MTKTKVAFVIPWRDLGRWIWQYLLEENYQADLCFAAAEPGIKRKLPPYLEEFVELAKRNYDFAQYDCVFTWELRSALATALLLRRIPKAKRPKFVAVGPILKGGMLKILPLLRLLLADADLILCFSSVECDDYAHLLKLPRERFRFVPTPWRGDEEVSTEDKNFILALGQSNRDYGTLLKAVTGTNLPLTIVAGNESALGGVPVPPNVTVKYNTGHHETNDLIAGATFHAIPLFGAGFSSGQTVLLRAMARGKAVAVTEMAGVSDYVHNGETALLVPPEDIEGWRKTLTHLWNDAPQRTRIGENAARAVREEFGFPRFAQRMTEIVKELKETTPK